MFSRYLLSASGFLQKLLTYDFCPWANRWVYWVKQPLAFLGLATAAAIACALWLNPFSLVGVVGVLLVLALGYLWPYLSMWGVSGDLEFGQTRISEGEPVDVTLTVTNRWPWPVWGLVVSMPPSLESEATTEASGDGHLWASLALVRGASHSQFSWKWTPEVRGDYPQVPLKIESAFPFGFRSASRPLTVSNRLVVWPRILPLASLLDASEVHPTSEVFTDRRAGDQGDLLGTRLFRQGDSLRRVHWAQTARHGRMIAIERQASIQSRVEIDLPTDQSIHTSGGNPVDSSLNWAVRIAASLSVAYLDANSSVSCRAGGQLLTVEHGNVGRRRLLDALARLKPTNDSSHVGHACHRGGFHLAVVTDKSVQGSHLHHEAAGGMIVIRTCGEHRCDDHHAHDDACRQAIWLDLRPDLGVQFQRAWKKVCHAG